MVKVLFVTPVPEEAKERFQSIPNADITFKERQTVTEEDLKDVEVILGNLPVSLLNTCDTLKWIQLDSAGANLYSDLKEEVILTNASGAYGEAI